MDKLKGLLAVAMLRMSALLPLSMSRALGRYFAAVYWPLGGRSRKVTEKNIAAAYPELSPKEQYKLAKRSLGATGELVGEMGHIWLKPWDYVSTLILEVHGAELFERAQSEGRGVVLLAPHLGNWEILGLHMATLGESVALYQPPKLLALRSLIKTARQRNGTRVAPTTRRGLVSLLSSVKNGNFSGILPDQVPQDLNAGENSVFMGLPCFTATLASNIIRRTGAVALLGVAVRVPGGFVIRYEPADVAIYSDDNTKSLAAVNAGVEQCLRYCPEQYQWEYKRFRARPKVVPGFYDDL
jgi:KDO2-lipid IV(A) lauroyltransferase